MKQLYSVRILALFFLILIGGGKTWAADDVTLSGKKLTLSGTKLTLDCGESSTTSKTGTLSITATDADDKTVTGLSYTYESNSTAVATVDENGTVTAVMAGNANITVSFAGTDTYEAASCTVSVKVTNSSKTATTKVYNNIAEVQDAAQSSTEKGTCKIQKCALVFSENNPATVVGVFTNNDPNISSGKAGAGYVFIVDKSNRGLMLIKPNKQESKYYDFSSLNLKTGDTFTGTLVGTHTEGNSHIPAFDEILSAKTKINEEEFTSNITVNTDGEATDTKDADYPINKVKDVNTLAETNKTVTDGDITKASYGPYLNTIVSVTGTIKENNESEGTSFYLVQDENITPSTNNIDKRIYLNSSQISGITMTDYVGTTGTFEGILIKRNDAEPKLVILKANFFEISKIYIDENDDENRINDLVKTGAFDDEVDIYVHRTKLVNTAAWNTLCFPFDLTKDEFKTAFGCELTNLAAAKTDENNNVDTNGNLLFETKTDLSISAGVPYIMKASGTQNCSTNTNLKLRNDDGTIKSPSEMMTSDATYYAHIGKKKITVVPPKEVKGSYKNDIVNGDFYFRGLYGQKKYTNDKDGNLTETPIADNGSQKYQYISTSAGNYLKYLPSDSKLAFNGLRAYFYFPNWNAENNKGGSSSSKIRIAVDGETTAIDRISMEEEADGSASAAIYNLNGQKVDSAYKGIVIRNGKKIMVK